MHTRGLRSVTGSVCMWALQLRTRERAEEGPRGSEASGLIGMVGSVLDFFWMVSAEIFSSKKEKTAVNLVALKAETFLLHPPHNSAESCAAQVTLILLENLLSMWTKAILHLNRTSVLLLFRCGPSVLPLLRSRQHRDYIP